MSSYLGEFGRNLLVAAVACAGISVAGTAALAADEPIDITIDFAKILKLDQPADTIIIGNPAIADASVNDERTLVLTGKTAGTTNLIAMDQDGEQFFETTLRVSSDIRQLTTVFLGAQRQTFSCSPVCEQVISVGDAPNKFEAAREQIQARQEFATSQ